MRAKQIKALAAELVARLSSRKFLEASGLSAVRVREVAGRDYWEPVMAQMFPLKKRVLCEEVLAMARAPMESIVEAPEEGWLAYIYAFVCENLFPDEEKAERHAHYQAAATLYLAVLQFFLDKERECFRPEPFVDFELLAPEEYERFESKNEYERFLTYYRDEFIYELFRLNMEVTTYKTLEHIAGVHYVAMHLARGLYEAGVPIDLGLVSGAAAGHDLGKFGCRPGENVPHMHYYYTDLWFSRHHIGYMGHIAANHSTWDLEPERLSVEALVLIYADFCVKQDRVNGENITHISTLDAAFDIILSKLENVDAEKEMRYRFVYARLKDFHEYMLHLGIDPTEHGELVDVGALPSVSLRNTEETVESLLDLGVETNIHVMHRMAAGRQFGNFLESARSESDLRHLQVYLRLFERYTAYTNDEQKRQTLAFLYELMMHREGEIRVEAAQLLGKIIAQFNFGYRKRYPAGMLHKEVAQSFELWRYYIEAILRPDLKLNEVQHQRIQSNLRNALSSLLAYASEEDAAGLLTIFMECFNLDKDWGAAESFALLNTVFELPIDMLHEDMLGRIGRYALSRSKSDHYEEKVAAWRAMLWLATVDKTLGEVQQMVARLEKCDTTGNVTLSYLKHSILLEASHKSDISVDMHYDSDVIQDIFLENLQAATPWIIKAVNIRLLSSQISTHPHLHQLHIAAHFSNLLKVNDIMVIPRDAGAALSQIIPLLRVDQRNEIMMELVNALEVADARYSHYIPEYLARTLLWLPLAQLDEMISHITELLYSASDGIAMRALDTIGNMLMLFEAYPSRFDISRSEYQRHQRILLGAILKGICSYKENVRQQAMLVLGDVFDCLGMSEEEKSYLFTVGCRKMLFLMSEVEGNTMSLFARASAISSIAGFINRWRMGHDGFVDATFEKVAFMPGTFDPFTSSHKEIARQIRSQGYEVYLAVDEFSWSKKAQPNLIRRKLVNMAVADEFHINIFPCNMPINIANPADLAKLKAIFDSREVYMVVGSDVVENASSYKREKAPDSIHSMNHIIFRRGDDPVENLDHARARISGKVDVVELPKAFRQISSTMLRDNVDLNRDVSNLVDPMVQGYIYAYGLYLREPEYKPIAMGKVLSFERFEGTPEDVLHEIDNNLLLRSEHMHEIHEHFATTGDSVTILRNMMNHNRLIGVARSHILSPENLYEVLGDVELANQVRRHTSGNILLLSGLYTTKDGDVEDPAQLLLTEVLTEAYKHGVSYAIYFPKEAAPGAYITDAVRRQGFVVADTFLGDGQVYVVDMREPIVVLRNLQTFIKEPLVSNPAVMKVIEKGYRRLQHNMTKLYPGSLVLTLSAEVIFPRLVEMITQTNSVPNEIIQPRVLGECMCVPFGRILRERVIPNTVTKTLHTDTLYESDLSDYTVEAFQNYTPLEDQVRMIHAFDRPVILVDDIMNIGKRFTALDYYLKNEGVPIRKMLFGVMTGVGRDRMTARGIDCDSVYYVPNVRKWYVESSLYPFIGGDSVKRAGFIMNEASPSVNDVFPYTTPDLAGASKEALYAFSASCVSNARDIFYALEEAYRARYGRNLTMERLGEVMTVACAPDRGECMIYDDNKAPSVYLDNDLQMLKRLYKK